MAQKDFKISNLLKFAFKIYLFTPSVKGLDNYSVFEILE